MKGSCPGPRAPAVATTPAERTERFRPMIAPPAGRAARRGGPRHTGTLRRSCSRLAEQRSPSWVRSALAGPQQPPEPLATRPAKLGRQQQGSPPALLRPRAICKATGPFRHGRCPSSRDPLGMGPLMPRALPRVFSHAASPKPWFPKHVGPISALRCLTMLPALRLRTLPLSTPCLLLIQTIPRHPGHDLRRSASLLRHISKMHIHYARATLLHGMRYA